MKKELSLKSKTLISSGLFLVIFTALVLIASYCDLAISKILTKNSLPVGGYISTNGFGLFFETIGSAPIFLMISIGAVVWFWRGIQHKKVWISIIGAIAIFVGFFLTVKDMFGYVLEAMSASINGGIPVDYEFTDKFYLIMLSATLSLAFSVLTVCAWKNVKPETNDALFKFLFIVIGVVACYLIVNFVKGPVGRMRFRTMNAIGDSEFINYTGWWVSNGKRAPIENLPNDQCKSFPSGHTYSAAVIYTLVCLPDMVKSWDKKWIRILLWAISIVFTGMVAISRIVVGAHFMSDVLFGGTISFMAMIIMREIFIFKGAHLKAVFCKKNLSEQECACCVCSNTDIDLTEDTENAECNFNVEECERSEKQETNDIEN